MDHYKILLVDDDPFTLTSIGRDLENEGYEVITTDSGEKACEILENESFDLIITDLVMGLVNGFDVLKKAKKLNSETVVIILTGFGNMTFAIDALRLDADDFLLKPCEPEEIHTRVSKCLATVELSRKVRVYEKILPICSVCKKIRDDSGNEPGTGEWITFEEYLAKTADIETKKEFCPDCANMA